ncbi:MAG: hypothetical protein AABY22_12185 [Nanoarchaeota archaeon]
MKKPNCNKTIDIRKIKIIKNYVKKGCDKIWVETASGEALILPKKYGDKWWKKAKSNDIRRILIH